ncbi:MAG: hypothetical protein EOO63_08260 [Hymenobacter sp.]|nr:MAG: hypothetical protein EOO63_08260 [Hymenobacter sp.]
MHAFSLPAPDLLVLLGLTLGQGLGFIKIVVALVAVGVVYQLVRHRNLFARTQSGYLLWWGGLMLLSWAALVYFAIEARWVWRFFFG